LSRFLTIISSFVAELRSILRKAILQLLNQLSTFLVLL